jgi:hypothetical protein
MRVATVVEVIVASAAAGVLVLFYDAGPKRNAPG